MGFSAEALMQLLHEKEIKQYAFSKACNISPSNLSSILNGFQTLGFKRAHKILQGMMKLHFTKEEIKKVFTNGAGSIYKIA